MIASAAALVTLSTSVAAGLPQLRDIEDLTIHYGVNTLPRFTPDGRSATIVMAWRENGNAHGHDTIMMWVEALSPSSNAPGMPQVIGVEGDDGGVADVVRNEPFDGEREIKAVRLVRARLNGTVTTLLVEAERRVGLSGISLADAAPAEIRVWKLEGPEDSVGRTPYFFRPVARMTTARAYCNATTALHRELGLRYPDGWGNGDSVDGC